MMTFNLFIYLLVIIAYSCHCKVITKCNVDNSSTVGLTCNNNEHISINAILYYQSAACSQTGSCYRSYRQGDVDFSPECQHVYGVCNQTLGHTVLDDCIPGNNSITVEVDYDCQGNQIIEGPSTVQVYGSSTTLWSVGISCPSQSVIYIESVAYRKLHNDSTCETSTWWIPVIIPSEQIRLNNLCIKQLRCQPVLLYNVTTPDGCNLVWPTIGAEIKYRCISNDIDVCSEVVKTNNDSLSTIYLTSPLQPNIQKVDSSCSCRIYGNKMDVRVLYLNLPTINSTRGSLYITPPRTSLLSLTTTSINTLLYSTISDVMVTFDDKNLNQQNMLLEFKAINNDSFLRLNCLRSEPNSPITRFTSTIYEQTTKQEQVTPATTETKNQVTITILAVLLAICLLALTVTIAVIIILFRKVKLIAAGNSVNRPTSEPQHSPYEGLDPAVGSTDDTQQYSQLNSYVNVQSHT